MHSPSPFAAMPTINNGCNNFAIQTLPIFTWKYDDLQRVSWTRTKQEYKEAAAGQLDGIQRCWTRLRGTSSTWQQSKRQEIYQRRDSAKNETKYGSNIVFQEKLKAIVVVLGILLWFLLFFRLQQQRKRGEQRKSVVIFLLQQQQLEQQRGRMGTRFVHYTNTGIHIIYQCRRPWRNQWWRR